MEYGIAIRTLGKAGEKYEKLMDSIRRQTLQPIEVLVVLPQGYPCPEAILGMERFAFADKGMMSQRVTSLLQSSCEYVLLLDDDVCFPDDFVERLAEPVIMGSADLVFPIHEALLPQKGMDEIMSILLLRAWPTSSNNYTHVTSTAGYSYRRRAGSEQEPVPAECAPGMCLFVRKSVVVQADLQNELWVDKPVYALKDDAVFVYKSFLCGARVFGIPNLSITHLDAGAAEGRDRKMRRGYAYAFNTIMFWRRLILPYRKSIPKKACAHIAIGAWIFMNGLFHIVRGLMDGRFTTYVQGIRDGFHEPLTVWDNKSIDDKRKPDGTRAKDRSIKP